MRATKPRWLYAGLGWILAGSAADLVLTLWGLRLGVIREANPLLAPLLASNPALASGLKLGVTAAGVIVLHRIYPASSRLVSFGVAMVGAALLVVLVMHFLWIKTV